MITLNFKPIQSPMDKNEYFQHSNYKQETHICNINN